MIVQAMPYPAAAGGGEAAYRYWRILVTDNTGSNEYAQADRYVGAAEIEFLETPGGADLSTTGGAFAQSFQGGVGDGYEIPNAFDNNPATRWASNGNFPLPQYIGQDLGSPKVIRQITWTPENHPVAAETQSPQDFQIQGADSMAGPWNTVWTETGHVKGTWGPNVTRVFTKP